MANSKSAEKRDRQRETRRLKNRAALGSMRTALKKARTAISEKSSDTDKLVTAAISKIDRAVSKGTIKRNTGSRYISRLMILKNKN